MKILAKQLKLKKLKSNRLYIFKMHTFISQTSVILKKRSACP